jgi:predicted O-linked N-acetylglucosamine transferase (SPINDLY family)
LGLPSSGVVFASLGDVSKITPDIFDLWMRLLRQVEGSVLWLAGGAAERNLRAEAAKRGVAADRLVFAPPLPYRDHLARLRVVDVCLDTIPFNGGATASDALWIGVPVVTLSGDAYASRMTASLLAALGLDELVASSAEDYEAIALGLARGPALRASIRDRLARDRATCPLFDARRFTRHLEVGYAATWERHCAGESPESIAIASVDGRADQGW